MIETDLNLKENTTLGDLTISQPIRMRCPECLKLYSVNSSEIFESKPKFACLDCGENFWIPFPEALAKTEGLIGYRVREKITDDKSSPPTLGAQVSKLVFNCPACAAPYSGGEKECAHCGVIFEKFELRQKNLEAPPASRELRELWDKVLDNYEDKAAHQHFVSQALGEGAAEYASYQYRQILDLNPSDSTAKQGQQMIGALSLASIESRVAVAAGPKFNFSLPKLSLGTFMIFLCGLVIAMGLLIPGARNLVGMGSAFLFLMLALRFYFRVI